MAEVLRDVAIRVSVKNGNMALGPLDISSFLKSIETACAATEALKTQLAGIKAPNVLDGYQSASSAGKGPSVAATTYALPASAVGLDEAFRSLASQVKSVTDLFTNVNLPRAGAASAISTAATLSGGRVKLGEPGSESNAMPASFASLDEGFRVLAVHAKHVADLFSNIVTPNSAAAAPQALAQPANPSGMGASFKTAAQAPEALFSSFGKQMQSVADRAAEGVQQTMGIMREQGMFKGVSDKDLEKVQAQLQKKAEMMVREQDREVAAAEAAYDREADAAIRSYSKIMSERRRVAEKKDAMKQEVSDNDISNQVGKTNRDKESQRQALLEAKRLAEESASAIHKAEQAQLAHAQSSRAAAAAALDFARGLALIASTGTKDGEMLARAVVEIQGYFNVIRGGIQVVHALNDAMKINAALRGAGAVAGVVGNAGAAGVAAGREAEAAGGGGGVNVIPAALPQAFQSLTGIVLGLVAAAALFQRQLNIWAVEADKAEKAKELKFTEIGLADANARPIRHVDQFRRAVAAVPNIGEIHQTRVNLARRGALEQQIQREQAVSDRDFAGRQEIRTRAEQAVTLQEHKEAAANDVATATKRQESLKGAKEQLWEDEKASREAHDRKIRELKRNFRLPTGVSRERALVTGEESDDDVKAHNARQQQAINTAKAERKSQESQELKARLDIEQQLLDVGQQRVVAAGRLVTATREQVAAARENYERDKQTVAMAHQSLGSMSAGERFMLTQIEAKRKTGQKWEQWEINQGLRAPAGTKLHDEAERQAQANDDTGLEMSVDVGKSKKKLDELQNIQEGQEPANNEIIDTQSKINEQMVLLRESLTKGFKTLEEEVSATVKKMNDQNAALEEKIRELRLYLK